MSKVLSRILEDGDSTRLNGLFPRQVAMGKFVFIRKPYAKQRLAWIGSPFEEVNKLGAHEKGRFGQMLIKFYLELKSGVEFRTLSHGGDLCQASVISGEEEEVKTACAKFSETGTITFFWNQIRPEHIRVRRVWLVAIAPDKVYVYLLDSTRINFAKLNNGHDVKGKQDARDKMVTMRTLSDGSFVFDTGDNPQPEFIRSFARDEVEIV
jgi:hypothetical protein